MARTRITPNAAKRGSIHMAVVISAAVMAVAYGVVKLAVKTQSSASSVASQGSAQVVNDIVLSRMAHAVALNAILCSEVSGECWWNEDLDSVSRSEFGISSFEENDGELKFLVESCTPNGEIAQPTAGGDAGSEASVEQMLSNCESNESEVQIALTSMEELIDEKIVSGDTAVSDQDKHVILVSVATNYKQSGSDNEFRFVTSGVVRRPRTVLRIDPGSGVCKPTCHLSDGPNGQHFCMGSVRIVNNEDTSDLTTTASSEVLVWNEGPGYLYGFQLYRDYKPNREFTAADREDIDTNQKVLVYDSTNDPRMQGQNGLAPGESLVISDQGLPCFDEKTFSRTDTAATNVVGAGNAVGAVVQNTNVTRNVAQSPTNARPSGSAVYYFGDIQPNNALMFQETGSAVDATNTHTHTHVHRQTTLVLVNVGMN